MSLFVASNGEYYTASEVVEHIESGRWTTCMWEENGGKELVEVRDGDLMLLVPTEDADFAESFRTESTH